MPNFTRLYRLSKLKSIAVSLLLCKNFGTGAKEDDTVGYIMITEAVQNHSCPLPDHLPIE